ncbi:phosphotransferase enzyme family protein [Verrucomicrobiota bacterium]
MEHNLQKITERFQVSGNFMSAKPYGSGHIHDTYAAQFDQNGTAIRYIIQRINQVVFKNTDALMENISRVTAHQLTKLKDNGHSDPHRQCLSMIPTVDEKTFYQDESGNTWRIYFFVENATTYDIADTPELVFQSAKAYGHFQKQLIDLPGKRLHETIPDFHNTPKRFKALEKAIEEDIENRAQRVGQEIAFALKHKDIASFLDQKHKEGIIPERITHNDTKLNNVMIDNNTREGICVIDLDTVMPGLIHHDFGDMVRSGTCVSAEDETDLSKVFMDIEKYEYTLNGYMESAGDFLSRAEKELLPLSGKVITFETGIRFLTDYLQGDIYFKTDHKNHNLDRCRVQFKMVESLISNEDKMIKCIS